MDTDGDFITEWGSLGSGPSQFNGPGAIAIDNQNKIVFVSDIKNNRIEKFDLDGNYITQWGIQELEKDNLTIPEISH